MIHSKQHRGCRIQDPGTRGYWWWKTADFVHSARKAHGAPPKWSKIFFYHSLEMKNRRIFWLTHN